MLREELSELHYISPLQNVRSIMDRGVLSHRRAERVEHQSIAMQEIQDIRAHKVPGGRPLHEYVNCYVNARNPMMYKRRDDHALICVLRVSASVLDLAGVIITDQNAASDYVRFSNSATGLALIDREQVFAESWIHPDDQIEEWRHKSRMCTEVLVPDRVPPSYILGAYVSCDEASITLQGYVPELPATVRPHIFFRGGAPRNG